MERVEIPGITALKHRSAKILARLFPERQVIIRTEARVSYLRIGQKVQIFATLALMVFGSWLGFSSTGYLMAERVLAAKNKQISNARLAYRNLMGEVADYQQKFIAITGDLEENHTLMLDLVEQNTALQQNLNSVEQELRITEAERQSVIATRERLKDNLADIQDNLHSLTSRNYLLRDNLNSIESDLQLALAERNTALTEGERLKEQVTDLEDRLSDLQETQISAVEALTQQTDDTIETMERVIEMAGIEVAELIEVTSVATPDRGGQGGPFVAVPDNLPGDELKKRLDSLHARLAHQAMLQTVMHRIPLTSPLRTYYVTSSFGKRQDPVNRKWSMHYGTDMGTTIKSPVYSTAPGVISYAGWKGKYGNLVEIDHGGGLKTRFGHLSKMHVKKGQEIGFDEKIGVVGSTGRSTGPHLHYEVVFNGKPLNPMKFVKAGRHVFQNQIRAER